MELYIHQGSFILLYSAHPLHDDFFCLRSLEIVQKFLNKDEHVIFMAGLCQSRDIFLIQAGRDTSFTLGQWNSY